ncbi:MAG TPA: hypothetical protein VFS88_06465 [Micavibrio sp.]|nr:hypothetical protein [Micavibrio sp.]
MTDADLTEEWNRIYALSLEEVKEELEKLGIDETRLETCQDKFEERLERLIYSARPKSSYKM